MVPDAFLYFLEVHWFTDKFIVLRKLFTGRKLDEDFAQLASTAVFVFDDSINDLLHFLGEIGRIGRQLFGRRPATLLLRFAVIVFVPAASAGGRGGAAGIHVPLAFARGLFLPHLLFDLLQGALFYGLEPLLLSQRVTLVHFFTVARPSAKHLLFFFFTRQSFHFGVIFNDPRGQLILFH